MRVCTKKILQDLRAYTVGGNVECCVESQSNQRTPLKTLARQAMAKEGVHIFEQALLGSTSYRDKDVDLDTDPDVLVIACHRERS